MSVISAKEHWVGRDGSFENVVDNSVTRTWLVKTDNKFDNQFTIVNHFAGALGIVFLTPHPNNAFYTARSLNAEQKDETPFAWEVSVTYSTSPTENEDNQFVNPLNRPAKVTWSSEFTEHFQILGTKEGEDELITEAMVNSAGFPFEPQSVERVRWNIQVVKNVSSVPGWVLLAPNRVNNGNVTIKGVNFAPRTLRIGGLTISDLRLQNEITYFELVYSLLFDPETWDLRLLNAGTKDKDGKPIKDESGNDVTEPWPLKEDGTKIDDPFTNPELLNFITYRVYRSMDFNNLPF